MRALIGLVLVLVLASCSKAPETPGGNNGALNDKWDAAVWDTGVWQ